MEYGLRLKHSQLMDLYGRSDRAATDRTELDFEDPISSDFKRPQARSIPLAGNSCLPRELPPCGIENTARTRRNKGG